MSHHHERLVCSCGAVIMQCRCIEPKTDKIVQLGCEPCKALRVSVLASRASMSAQSEKPTAETAVAVDSDASPYAEAPGRDYRKERDSAYTERNRLVAALARLIMDLERDGSPKAWLAEHDPTDAGWDPEWRTIVFIDGPTGQLSWHLHDSDVPLFDGFPRGENYWDGHSTSEKYERVARLGR